MIRWTCNFQISDKSAGWQCRAGSGAKNEARHFLATKQKTKQLNSKRGRDLDPTVPKKRTRP